MLRALLVLGLASPCAPALSLPLTRAVQAGPAGAAAAGHQVRYSLRNLGVAVDDTTFWSLPSEGPVAVLVKESGQGGGDLNGDGDALDRVVHVCDPVLGTLSNLALASPNLGSHAAARFTFAVSEADQGGADLNGDGDALDRVAFVHDATSGVTTNLGLAVKSYGTLSSELLVVSVSEADQGGADLNGDGDSADWVVFVVELGSGLVHNLGLAQANGFGPFSAFDGLASFAVSEAAQGQDLDGDGLLTHDVVHVHDRAQGLTINLGLATKQGTLAGPGQVWLVVPESAGNDFNADGDVSDQVAHVFDATSGTTGNTGYAVLPFPLLTASHLVFLVPETQQGGVDLNGDGDALDQIVHARDLSSGATTFAPWAHSDGDVRSVGDRLALVVNEIDQGGVDLDGDGDANDYVVVLFDPQSAASVNTGLANGLRGSDFSWIADTRGGERYLGVPVLEAAQGASDLDGDGDASDFVVHHVEVLTGAVHNSGRGSGWASLGEQRGKLAPYAVGEAAWGGKDLNADGDLFDHVLGFWHTQGKATVDVPMALGAFEFVVRDSAALFLASESFQGGTDLNGDGDALDRVLFQLRVQ